MTRGKCRIGQTEAVIEDTPGMYSLLPITEEERAARDVLLDGSADTVLHVVDAKNLQRMLPLTLQLGEAGLSVVLVLNMIDEAERLDIQIDETVLEDQLGMPVVSTVALTGKGVEELRLRLETDRPCRRGREVFYGEAFEGALESLVAAMPEGRGLSKRSLALLLLQGDESVASRLGTEAAEMRDRVSAATRDLESAREKPPSYSVPLRLHEEAARICDEAFLASSIRGRSWVARVSDWTMSPITGVPLLLLVLYYGLYKFVGEFGAGTLVDLLEGDLFAVHVNPWVNGQLAAYIPWAPVRDLIGGEYGLVTLGIRYAVAIILPIVATFFIAFSILEDTGYLPRLAMLVDRVFKKIGLNGRAVIPMTLGFGCDTMATMVTRTLESKRERLIATVLLALAIPCSAQLGVILGMMAAEPAAMGVWAGTILIVFLLIGSLLSRVMPGEKPVFFMEVPPLRAPRLAGVLTKTYSRMQWYFLEILPLFLLASVLIWLGRITGVFDLTVAALAHVMGWIGLPSGAAVAFLFGFFRRDYGVAGLYDLQQAGALTGNQLAVAAVTLTLFVPCVAQFLMMKKERGVKVATVIGGSIFAFAFLVGGAVNGVLSLLGVSL